MTWQRVSNEHKWLCKRVLQECLMGLLLCAILAGPAWCSAFWIGEGENNLWTTVENWDKGREPTPADGFVFLGAGAQGNNGPLIEDGIKAVISRLAADEGRPKMTMTGGSLELTGNDLIWGEARDTRATFEMEGGVIDAENAVLVLGRQSSREPPKSANGKWEMTGGEVTVKGLTISHPTERPVGTLELFGGVMNVGSDGLEMARDGTIEVRDGILVLDGDQQAVLDGYIANGWIETENERTLLVEVSGGKTTLSATNPFEPGDYNEDGVLDAVDIDLQSAEMKKANPDLAKFDHNGDGEVNVGTPGADTSAWGDRLIWIRELRKTSVGDSNLDNVFDSGDLVLVFAGGKYESGENATWELGDWNGDMEFGSGDLVFAFSDGGYVAAAAPAAIPEPSSLVLIGMATFGLVAARRRRARR